MFFGRTRTARDLADQILSHRMLTVYGPSGAGKSSILQASVVPALTEEWELRTVVVDAWPPHAVLADGPVGRLVDALCTQLELAPPEEATVDAALRLAFRSSDRPLLIVLDQAEQLVVNHEIAILERFVAALVALEAHRGVPIHVVLALREDYLGRWADLVSAHPALTRHQFRLPRMRVDDVTSAVIDAASAGSPPQVWTEAVLRPLIEEMAVPGQWKADRAEVECAYVQIVCRALWDAGGQEEGARRTSRELLHGYLSDALGSLGALEAPARALLESRLVTGSGTRVPVSLAGARDVVPDAESAQRILDTLEAARILRAWDHHGDRFFELGHDWLALPIREAAERRAEEARAKARRRRRWGVAVVGAALAGVTTALFGLYLDADWARRGMESALVEVEAARRSAVEGRVEAERDRRDAETQRAEAERQRTEADTQRTEAERAKFSADAAGKAAMLSALEAEQARGSAEAALGVAAMERDRARGASTRATDALRMLAARELVSDPERALRFLGDVYDVEHARGWRAAAWSALQVAVVDWTVEGGGGAPVWRSLGFSPDGTRVALGGADGTVAIWELGSWRPPKVLGLHHARVRTLVFNRDGSSLFTSADDGSAALWLGPDHMRLDLPPQGASVWSADFNVAGDRLATGGRDGKVTLWTVPAAKVVLQVPNEASAWSVQFAGQGSRWLAATADGRVELRSGDDVRPQATFPSSAEGCEASGLVSASFVGASAEILVTTSDGRALRWTPAAQASACTVAVKHADQLRSAVVAPDGRRILALGVDGAATLSAPSGSASRQAFGAGSGMVPSRGGGSLVSVALGRGGALLAAAAAGGGAVLLDLDEEGRPRRAARLSAPSGIQEVWFSPDGERLLTLARDGSVSVWRTGPTWLSEPITSRVGDPVVRIRLDGRVVVGQTRGGAEVHLPIPEALVKTPTAPPPTITAGRGEESNRLYLRFPSPDGETTGAAGSDPVSLEEHAFPIVGWEVDPQGRFVVSLGSDGTVLVWGMASDAWVHEELNRRDPRCVRANDRIRYLGEEEEEVRLGGGLCRD